MSLTPRYPESMPNFSDSYPTTVVLHLGAYDLVRRVYPNGYGDSWFLVSEDGGDLVRAYPGEPVRRPSGFVEDHVWNAVVAAINLMEPS